MFCWFDLLDFISINAYKRAHIISIESFLHMFISLPVSSLPCCLLGNVCHSVLPPLARPTLGRTQPSPDPKPLLPFHLLPGFTDVSTVSHCSCHSNTTSHLLYSPAFFMTNHNRSRATLFPNTLVLPTPFQIYCLWYRELWHFYTACWGGTDTLIFLTQTFS